MANNINQQIEARVQSFVQELSGLVRAAALEAVADALGGKPVGAARRGRPVGSKNKVAAAAGKAAPAAPAARRKRGKRTSEEVDAMAARILDHVKKTPGTSVEKMAKAFRVASKELTLPITKLMGDKKMKTTGQKRGTKYFVK